MEAVLRGHGSDSLGRHRGFPIGMECAGIWLQISLKKDHDFRHDRATIGSRSGHDRGLIVTLNLRRSLSDRMEALPQRKLPDRGLIAPRSWSSSASPVSRPIEVQMRGRSDCDREAQLIAAVRSDQVRWAVRLRGLALPQLASVR